MRRLKFNKLDKERWERAAYQKAAELFERQRDEARALCRRLRADNIAQAEEIEYWKKQYCEMREIALCNSDAPCVRCGRPASEHDQDDGDSLCPPQAVGVSP